MGRALESLERLWKEGAKPFDLVFIDADKENMPSYVEWALRLSRPGTAIVCDNVVRKGAVVDAESTDANVRGVRRFFVREPNGRVINVPNVASTRAKTGLSQAHFAKLLGVSVRTLQDWEQGRRAPSGAARTLLAIAAKNPQALLDVA